MTRVLKLRPLCDQCERAEAVAWSANERRALCARCDASTRRGAPSAPIAASSVVSALCSRCATAPAALVLDATLAALCRLCARDEPAAARRAQALRDSHVASSFAFDRMDFSTLLDARAAGGRAPPTVTPPRKAMPRKRPLETRPLPNPSRHVDLSYFKTPIPLSVARAAPRASATLHQTAGVRAAPRPPAGAPALTTAKLARVSRGRASKSVGRERK